MPNATPEVPLERLPALLDRKIYKTGQTRGATVREIYQNRVGRNSTVLIPYAVFDQCSTPTGGTSSYENGSIILVEPSWYFETVGADDQLRADGIEIGANALLLFQRRGDWAQYSMADGSTLPNGRPFSPGLRRTGGDLGGTYMARVHSTTAETGSEAVVRGYTSTQIRGAGIRVYEYADSATLDATRLQLEALMWLCKGAGEDMVAAGMSRPGMEARLASKLSKALLTGLLDFDRLEAARMVDSDHFTICPLCLDRISAADFLKREAQAEGRQTWDNTVTELSLFHIEELRVGRLGHKEYNLGWGHHFCNVVVKDAGIVPTLRWMKRVLDNNGDSYEAIARQERLVEEAVEL